MFGSNRPQSHERTTEERERAREERERARAERAAEPLPEARSADPGPPESGLDPIEPIPEGPEPTPNALEPVGGPEHPLESEAEPLTEVGGPTGLAPEQWADTIDFAPESPVEPEALEPGPEVDAPESLDPVRVPVPDPDLVDFHDAEEPLEEDSGSYGEEPAEHVPVVAEPVEPEVPIGVRLPPPARAPERIPPPPELGSGRRRRRGRSGSSGDGAKDRGHAGSVRDSLLERRAQRLQAHRANVSGGRRGFTKARAGALVVLVVVLAIAWFLWSVFQPFAGSGHGKVIVSIPRGSSSGQVGSILAQDGVVSSDFFFQARALLEGKRGELHSGRFQMKQDMSYAAAIETLTKPPPATITVSVVIPEGETRRQIATIAHAHEITGSYLVSAKRSTALKPTRYGAPKATPNLEGFLFPATYEMRAGAPASQLVTEQLTAFTAHFGATQERRASELGVTPYQLLTVASMVEREAQVERDRPLIAAVIYNRLKLGMTLGIDATIRYALNDYTQPLTESQLKIDSPYNTRLHRGLPPTPISNPGVASIEAAAHPAHVSYLYYVANSDGCGAQVFSSTYAQFEHDAALYREALAHNHGRVPTCKK